MTLYLVLVYESLWKQDQTGVVKGDVPAVMHLTEGGLGLGQICQLVDDIHVQLAAAAKEGVVGEPVQERDVTACAPPPLPPAGPGHS